MQIIVKSESKGKVNSFKTKHNKQNNWGWIIKISILSFSISLLLGFLSELFIGKNLLLLSIIFLIFFMFCNVFCDMLGLAITSCQITSLKNITNKKVYRKSVVLVKNADKVSSLLCDVVGDVSGILCGIAGTVIVSFILKSLNLMQYFYFFGAFVSAVIAGLTVFFKAILKNYAVKNSTPIVTKIAKILCIKP